MLSGSFKGGKNTDVRKAALRNVVMQPLEIARNFLIEKSFKPRYFNPSSRAKSMLIAVDCAAAGVNVANISVGICL